MTKSGAIRFVLELDGKGGCVELSADEISQKLKSDKVTWIHMDATHKETRAWILKEFDYLDDLILDALLADEPRPRVLEFDEGAALILRGMNFNKGSDPEDMVAVRLWIDPYRIITLERRHVKAIHDIEDKLKRKTGPKTSGDFLVQLSSKLFGYMEPVLSDLDETIDDIEEKVIESPDLRERQTIIDIRRKTIIFHRYISPQRDVMQHLRVSDLEWLDTINRRHIQENYDRVLRYIEDLDSIRERAQIVKDELTNALSDKLNKNLYLLSLIAAIFLPMGFLTGLLGINIDGIPGAHNPDAFWYFVIGLFVLLLVQIGLFKKLKWF